MDTNIQPVTIFPDTATKLRIDSARIVQLGAGGSAVIGWSLTCRVENSTGQIMDDKILKTGDVFIGGDEYDLWTADDSYILDVVMQKLGLKKADPAG